VVERDGKEPVGQHGARLAEARHGPDVTVPASRGQPAGASQPGPASRGQPVE
jgi:hypothetical protein